MIRPLFGSTKTYINDRFFVSNSLGYFHIGHTETPNAPPLPQHLETEDPQCQKVILGDDLGSENYFMGSLRFDFVNIPYLRDWNLKTFTYGEAAVYPSYK